MRILVASGCPADEHGDTSQSLFISRVLAASQLTANNIQAWDNIPHHSFR